MREDRWTEVKTNMLECLTLRFVDSHFIGQMDRKLQAAERNRRIFYTWVKSHARNKDHIVSIGIAFFTQHMALQDLSSGPNELQASTIVETMNKIQIV